MYNSSLSGDDSDEISNRSNLEVNMESLECASNGIPGFCNDITEFRERNITDKEIDVCTDGGLTYMSSTSLSKKLSEQMEQPEQVESIEQVVVQPEQVESIEHVVSQPTVSLTRRRLNLWYFMWLKLIYAYDSGAFSAAIGVADGIADEWQLSTTQQGELVSTVFLGTIIGCLISGHLFSIYNQKKVLLFSVISHTFATFFFALFSSFYIGIVSRFMLGITLSFVVVYVPVWVEEFAPKGRESIWMGSHNVAVPLGIILGYLVCAYFILYAKIGWRYAFFVKCLFMLPTIICLTRVDAQSINTYQGFTVKDDLATGKTVITKLPNHPSVDINSDDASARPNRFETIRRFVYRHINPIWEVLRPLLCNAVFMLNVVIMCEMFFISTGLQNFLTQYLREEPFSAPMPSIMIGFGVSVLTAPVLGVIVGAVALDFCGGYSDDLFRVSIFGLLWSISGAIFATICIFMTKLVPFITIMSLMLFCGGAIIPFATGLTMSSLPERLRPAGAAFSQVLCNFLGNFAGPMVCSLVADAAGGLKYGIMTLFLFTNLGVILMMIILVIAIKIRNNEKSTSQETVIFDSANDAH